MVSEENDDVIIVEDPRLRGKYIVVFDPLDGSSNIDAGVPVGTIFGIYQVPANVDVVHLDRAAISSMVLRPGSEMIAAGYAMYGSFTTLVLSTGHGVNGYTLDPSLGEFILTNPNIEIPKKGKVYSVNDANQALWDAPVRAYFDSLKETDPGTGKPSYSSRYIGSMVADVHRTLLYGGIFAYPADQKSRKGKLRLFYECFPMSFLMEHAGGKALANDKQRILDLQPQSIHDRSAIILGSPENIDEFAAFFRRSPQ